MKVRFSVANFVELMETVKEQTGAVRRSESAGEFLEFPERLGKGYLCGLQVRPGLELTIHDSEFQEPLLLEGEYFGHRQIGFGFCLAGRLAYTVQGIDGDLCMYPKQSLLSLSPPDFRGAAEYAAGQRIQMVGIGVEPDIFTPLCEGQVDGLPPLFTRLVEGKHDTYQRVYFQLGMISSAMQLVLTQVLNCPYQGVTKRLYLESKALELIALFLMQMLSENRRPSAAPVLRPDDIERIHRAREVLLDKMDEPPSLLALARHVGLNDFKLKAGFRQIFGTTVFGYLHDQRLARARQLLEERSLNVTEVACAVGYANPSHFAAAFRRKFGMNPGAYSREYCNL
jgi:AraC family transcriptional activator of pyochelin receptor